MHNSVNDHLTKVMFYKNKFLYNSLLVEVFFNLQYKLLSIFKVKLTFKIIINVGKGFIFPNLM